MHKTWLLKTPQREHDLLTTLLRNRNLKTEEEIDRFLNPSLSRDLHDPFLFQDMTKAVARIKKAILEKERIIIFGDYDVDGITGSAILIHTLLKLGAKVSYRLPHRMQEGYGLREKFIKEFAELKVKLLITVDNGISAKKEIDLANSLNIDVIITDHHEIPRLRSSPSTSSGSELRRVNDHYIIPNAFAILHPKANSTYPFADLTGAGVAFKLAKALIVTLLPESEHEALIASLLDLACMGTIADMGILHGENRAIVKFGLKVLEQTRWPGLSRLKQTARITGKIGSHDIGFIIGPRLNAAGRLSHPHYALQLLLDDGKNSQKLADNLEVLNRKRQEMMNDFLKEAWKIAQTQAESKEKIIFIANKNWSSGIVGLIAGRLSEKFWRPAFIMEDRGEILVGSARSIPGFSVIEAISNAKKLLTNYGGHEQAAGFELKKGNLKEFQKILQNFAKKNLDKKNLTPSMLLECEINPQELTLETFNMISGFEPFGFGNEAPRFLLKRVMPSRINLVGRNKNHIKFTSMVGDREIDCIGFNFGDSVKFPRNQPINLACELLADEWNGRQKLTLKILDFKAA